MLGSIKRASSKHARAALAPAASSCKNSRSVNCTRRLLSTTAPTSQQALKSTPLFNQSSSVWDQVFDGVDKAPPLIPQAKTPLPRKQTMTASEKSAFDDMFSMIFDAVATHKANPSKNGDVSIGRQSEANIFESLRKHSKRIKWTQNLSSELDLKNEEISRCETDQELLEWAMKNVFEESVRLEESSRAALAKAEAGEAVDVPMLQSPTYPHMIAVLMSTFRDTFQDPHLALSIFDHARHLSVPSYVFGCTTMAYNELIETKWMCFRDLKGVYETLVEMTVNGVGIDSRTRKLVETVRNEVGERTIWAEEDAMGQGEVWDMLTKIEDLARDRSQKSTDKWDSWKSEVMTDKANDSWGFDQWGEKQQAQSWRRNATSPSLRTKRPSSAPRKQLLY